MQSKYYDPKLEEAFSLLKDNKPFDIQEVFALCKEANPVKAYVYLRAATLYTDHPQYMEFFDLLLKDKTLTKIIENSKFIPEVLQDHPLFED
jgi:hypothetical protein